jgi:hypothetical protein
VDGAFVGMDVDTLCGDECGNDFPSISRRKRGGDIGEIKRSLGLKRGA